VATSGPTVYSLIARSEPQLFPLGIHLKATLHFQLLTSNPAVFLSEYYPVAMSSVLNVPANETEAWMVGHGTLDSRNRQYKAFRECHNHIRQQRHLFNVPVSSLSPEPRLV